MKTLHFLCCILLLVPICLYGQPDKAKKKLTLLNNGEKVTNFGFKGGFTSSLFMVSDFSINGVRIKEIQNNYQIGYFGAVFMRINFERHFLQPEISYNINRCNITFAKPEDSQTTNSIGKEASITSSIHSLDIPVIYGYNIIKNGPYSLAIFGGPKIRYIWDRQSKVIFENFDQQNIHEQLYPLNISFTSGVAISISQVFFDFRYDIGLHNISKQVTYTLPEDTQPGENNEIRFHRRDHVLSFSFGVIF